MSKSYASKLNINIKIFYINSALGGLLFTIPVWVAFHQRYLSYSQISLMVAVAYFVSIVLELPTGALADLIGRKRTIIIGQIFTGVFRILLGFAVNPVMFYIGWIGEAIGKALISGSDTALLYDSLKQEGNVKKFPRIIAKSSFLSRTVLIAAVFSGGYLYQYFVSLPFILRGSAYLLMSITSLFMIEPKIDTYVFNINNYLLQTKQGIQQLIKTSYLKTLTIYYMVVAGIIWVCDDYFVNTFAKDSGYTETEQSWIFAAFYLIGTLVLLFITRSEMKMPSKKSIYLTMVFLLVVSLIPGYFASKFLVFFLILGIDLSSALKGAFLDNYVNEEIASKYRATAMSGLNLLVSGVYMLILLGTGNIQDKYTNRAVWSLLGVAAFLILIPIVWILLRNHRINSKLDSLHTS